jgi:ribonuclease-3
MRRAKGNAIVPERLDSLKRFQKKIGVWFADPLLLNRALTHSSFPDLSNERLEFLGDSILSLVVGEYIFRSRPSALEGEMTTLRSDLVREETLAEVARGIDLGEYLLLGEGETRSGGAEKTSILSDAYEALVGAIYIEEGLDEVRDFVHRTLIKREKTIPRERNHKSLLQEMLARNGNPNPSYRVAYEEGPDHRKTFTVEAVVSGKVAGRGTGRSKKVAEQRAARDALKNLKVILGAKDDLSTETSRRKRGEGEIHR